VARYLLDNPAIVAGRSVLDLGAGSGLGAIAAAKAGSIRTLAADIDPFALAAMALNAQANRVTIEMTSEDLLARAPPSFDVVLVGDLFYERPLAECVLAFAQSAKAAGADVLVGDPRRSYFPRDKFVQVAEYHVPVTRELEDAEIKRTAIWRLA
jgi:predicted nicotinamide N-methyase